MSEAHHRRRATPGQDGHGRGGRIVEIEPDEALRLLAGVRWGRVIFSENALPAVRLVNHVVDDDGIAIRAHTGAAILGPAEEGAVVAYEADSLDDDVHTGWWTVVTGMATLVRDPDQRARLEERVEPWAGTRMEHVVRIRPDIVAGYRLL